MGIQLEQDIEELQRIVERRLGLCPAARNDSRCTLPAGHEPADAHQFQRRHSPEALAAGAP